MMAKLFDAFFGCWHSHYSFPITMRKNSQRSTAASLTGTYVVCLDCGKELPYNWDKMKIAGPAVADRSSVVGSLEQAA